MTKSLHQEIVALGRRIQAIAEIQEDRSSTISTNKRLSRTEGYETKNIIADIKGLLGRIDREIPLLQLAITASGESLSSSLPPCISPSRLLQASTLLTVGDTQFNQARTSQVQIGPVFSLSLYMLFLSHSSLKSQTAQQNEDSIDNEAGDDFQKTKTTTSSGAAGNIRKPIWQEVIHKARVRLCRASQSFVTATSTNGKYAPAEHTTGDNQDELDYTYHLEIVEDLADGRIHEIDETSISERIPIYQVSKMFYTDSGKLLNIGSENKEGHNPILLLKRDVCADPPYTEVNKMPEYQANYAKNNDDGTIQSQEADDQAEIDHQLWQESTYEAPLAPSKGEGHSSGFRGLPKHLDQEWLAMEMFEDEDDDGEGSSIDDERSSTTPGPPELPSQPTAPSRPGDLIDSQVDAQIRNLSLDSVTAENLSGQNSHELGDATVTNGGSPARSPFEAVTSSLSLIEMLIRLASLQEFQQASHLSIPDHILTFFLEETSTTGMVGEAQWKARAEAKSRVGFDPYSNHPAES